MDGKNHFKVYNFCKLLVLFVYLKVEITERKNGQKWKADINPVAEKDYKQITQKRYFFNWKEEQKYQVLKLSLKDKDDILGLMSLELIPAEFRIRISLLALSAENVGRAGRYEGIAGCLIAYACRLAVSQFGEKACVSLVPKTKLRQYYINEYGMLTAGNSLYLADEPLLQILSKYHL